MSDVTLERCEAMAKTYRRFRELLDLRDTLYNTYHSPALEFRNKSAGNLSDPTAEAVRRIGKIDEELLPIMKAVFAFEDDLHALTDYEVAAIIRWHYLIGLSWTDTNMKVYGTRDYNYSRKKVLRYLKQHKNK